MSLDFAELDPVYGTVTHEEAVTIANLGAQCYSSAKEQLYALWSVSQDDTEQQETWRKEGAAALMESLKGRLATGEAAQARVAVLQASVEAEVTRRVEEVVTVRMKEVELAKREELLVTEKKTLCAQLEKEKEIMGLKHQLAELQGLTKQLTLLEEAHSHTTTEVARLTEELTKFKDATATKSSHALGKIGEATVLEMIRTHLLPRYMYSEVYNMTAIKHAGDFHLKVIGPSGKHVKIMIDVKKYTTAVSNVEVEKLYNDLDGCDVDVGLLLSLDSGVSSKTQFQITKTKTGKPCMFLSMEKLDDVIRKEILSWAVQVLVSVTSIQDRSKQDTMVIEIQRFLGNLKTSLDDVDECVKMAKGLYERIQSMRERIAGHINTYRVTCGMDSMHAVDVTVGKMDMRCQGVKINGEPCKSRRLPSSMYCSRHAVSEAKKGPKIVVEDDDSDTISHVD
jgi:hypothetical protein